jgi:hypothetical protein
MTFETDSKRIKSLFGDDEVSFDLPVLLHPGEVLIVRITSQDIIQQFRFDNRLEFGIKWSKTENMMLEITHSMSKRVHETRFELDMDELKRANDPPKGGAKRGALREAVSGRASS